MKHILLDKKYLPDSPLELQFADLWLSYSRNQLHCQYSVKPTGHKSRPYLLDFAHPKTKIAIEIQGGTWMKKSGHNTGTGLNRDYTKLNRLQLDGWVVIQLSCNMIKMEWVEKIEELINERKTSIVKT